MAPVSSLLKRPDALGDFSHSIGSPGGFRSRGEANADFVLMLEREELKEDALSQANCDARFNITVDVRGLSVEHGGSILRGNAHYPHCVERNDQTVQNLTCQAFATAWGFRPSGQLEIPSHLVCTAGQSTPAPNRVPHPQMRRDISVTVLGLDRRR